MIKKASHYIPVAILSVTVALTASTFAQLGEDVQWLCSGRYVVEEGFVIYDNILALWLAFAGVSISVAYFAIPKLIQAVRKGRSDVTGPIDQTMVKFIVFICACGVGHIIDAANIWLHWYYLAAGWHTFTAIVSIDTFVSLRKHGKFFLAMPSREDYDRYIQVSEVMQEKFGTGFWYLDFATQKVKWSQGARRVYGKPQNWKVDFDEIDNMVMPEYREYYKQETAEHRKHGGEKVITYGILVDGVPRIIKAGIYNITDIEGNVTGIYGYIENITDQQVSPQMLVDSVHGPLPLRISTLQYAMMHIQQSITELKLTHHGRTGD